MTEEGAGEAFSTILSPFRGAPQKQRIGIGYGNKTIAPDVVRLSTSRCAWAASRRA